ncbi:hypothetical protein E4558_25775, partial [Escherichia coli]|nr:hypothetical protein [Escherichia coli]
PLTDFRGKTSIFSHPVYLFLRKFSLQDSRGGSIRYRAGSNNINITHVHFYLRCFCLFCHQENKQGIS